MVNNKIYILKDNIYQGLILSNKEGKLINKEEALDREGLIKGAQEKLAKILANLA